MSDEALTTEEVQEEVAGLGSADIESLRDAARHDLYFLAKGILGYKDINEEVHGQFCLFVQSEEKTRRLGLMPRAHLKSTIATITDSLRLTLIDPVDSRTLIVNEVEDTASDFLKELKNHWMQNQLLRQLFPELAPTRVSGPGLTWGVLEATLPGVEGRICKEPHWRARGIGGALTGGHYHRIKNDDLIGFDAAHSPAEMARAIKWNDNITPLLVDQHTDIIDWIGTRWARNDLYAHIMKGYGDDIAVYTRSAIEDGKIIFPAKHTESEYRYLQTNSPMVWFAQYLNDPHTDGKKDLPAEALRPFRFTLDGLGVGFLDSAGKPKTWQFGQLDIVLTVDPNSGEPTAPDTAAICVTGISPDDEIFVLSSESHRWSPSGFVDRVFETAKRWRPRVVGIEKAGQQNTHHYFEKKIQQEGTFFRIELLTPRNRQKTERIRGAMEPIIRSGRLYVLMTQTVLRKQITEFPENDADLVDELDALAYSPEIWRSPFRVEELESNRVSHKKILARRSSRTGY